jgi:hypothetical protein
MASSVWAKALHNCWISSCIARPRRFFEVDRSDGTRSQESDRRVSMAAGLENRVMRWPVGWDRDVNLNGTGRCGCARNTGEKPKGAVPT